MSIGIDLGTSKLKILLLDESGEIAARQSVPLVVHRPLQLWSEQKPEDWFDALDKAMLDLSARIDLPAGKTGKGEALWIF